MLPDRLGRRAPGARGTAWYRVQVPPATAQGICGVLLRHVHPNAVVYLNGEWLGQGGRFAAGGSNVWNRPLYYTFSTSSLRGDVNWLEIGIEANGGVFNGVDAPILGFDRVLRPRYERLMWLRVRIAEASTLLSLGVVVLFLALGLTLREAPYLLLSLAAACFAVNSLNYHLREPPIGFWAFNTIVNTAISWMCCAFVIMVLRLLGLSWRRLELGLLLFAGFVLAAAIGLSGPTFDRLALFWHLPPSLMCLVALTLFAVHRRALEPLELAISSVTGFLMVVIGVHDLAVQFEKQAGAVDVDVVHWMPYLGLTMLLGFGAAMLVRFLNVYRAAQRANRELQRQIAAKRADLEASFERMRMYENERIVLEERERLTREMHDGMGGHLVATLAMLETGSPGKAALSEALRDALDDMRLVIHSLQPDTTDILGLLADLRGRLEPRLSSHGLRFEWAVSDLPQALRLNPSQVLQILRIVQESITNVLKHANATRVRIATGSTASPLGTEAFVEISDDGHGQRDLSITGKGIPNMKERARRAGGQLDVRSGSHGTIVRLSLPVPRS